MPKLEIQKRSNQAEANMRRAAETQKLMDDAGYNPIEAMMTLAQDDGITDNQFKFLIHKELAKYSTPQLRAVDISGGMDNSLNVTVINFEAPSSNKAIEKDADIITLIPETTEELNGTTDTVKLVPETIPT
ncbi:MAG TPA: hypothetical protein EYQ21_05520 [Flavobacteriales bacterium]|nr:hypothetical protein [Flavobacteriales bacterium]